MALRLTVFKACSDSVTSSQRFQQGPVVLPGGIGGNSQMPEIKASISGLRSSVTFARGQQYRDFDAGIDEVAACSIGGLVAGKMLAKAGFFAVVLKFWENRVAGPGRRVGGPEAVFFGFGQKEA